MSRPKAESYTTIKVRTSTLSKLRMLYGLTEERMIDILEELVEKELKRVKRETITTK